MWLKFRVKMNCYSKCLATFLLLLICNISYAAQQGLSDFMMQIESLMNRRQMDEIARFYKFYTLPGATFEMEVQYVDGADPTKVLSQQKQKMNLDDYLLYLKLLLEKPERYSYSSSLQSISSDKDPSFILVSINANDSSATSDYDAQKKADFILYTLGTMNCSYLLESKNTLYYIKAMSCSKKISRTAQYPK